MKGNKAMATPSSNFGALAETVGEQADDYSAQTMDQAKKFYKTSRDYVENNPEKSLAIAAAVGVILGGLLTATMMRRH